MKQCNTIADYNITFKAAYLFELCLFSTMKDHLRAYGGYCAVDVNHHWEDAFDNLINSNISHHQRH